MSEWEIWNIDFWTRFDPAFLAALKPGGVLDKDEFFMLLGVCL